MHAPKKKKAFKKKEIIVASDVEEASFDLPPCPKFMEAGEMMFEVGVVGDI